MEMAVEQNLAPITDKPAPSLWEQLRDIFRGHFMAVVGLLGIVFFILVAIFAPLIAPQNPYDLAKNSYGEGRSCRSRCDAPVCNLNINCLYYANCAVATNF